MKHKLLTIGLPIFGGLVVAGIGVASAAGFLGGAGSPMGFGGFGGGMNSVSPTAWAANQATMFQNEATALGLPLATITNGWASGQSIEQVATANGISSSQYQTDMKNYSQSQQKDDLDALVTQGTITGAQETQYLQSLATQQAAMQAKMQNASGTWQGGRGGFGGMRGHKPASTGTTSTN